MAIEPLLERGVPGIPAVGVRDVGHTQGRAGDQEADGVGELVPMGDVERRDLDLVSESQGFAGHHRQRLQVAEIKELAPRTVRGQVVDHPRRGVERKLAGVDGFKTEKPQTRVVSEVSVGQEDAVDRCALDAPGRGLDVAQALELSPDIGGRVEEERAVVGIDQGKRGDEAFVTRVPARELAARATASRVGEATVLRRAENAQPELSGVRWLLHGSFPGVRRDTAQHCDRDQQGQAVSRESQNKGSLPDIRSRHGCPSCVPRTRPNRAAGTTRRRSSPGGERSGSRRSRPGSSTRRDGADAGRTTRGCRSTA